MHARACSQKCSFGLDSIMWQEDLKIGQNYPLKIESVSLVFTCLNNWQIVIETKYVVHTKVTFQYLSLVTLFSNQIECYILLLQNLIVEDAWNQQK